MGGAAAARRSRPPRLHRRDLEDQMAPLRGWSPRGERLPAKVPHGHWRYHDVPRRLAARPGRGAMAPRRADQRRDVPPRRRQHPCPATWRKATSSSWTISARTRARPARHQGGRRPPAFPAQDLPDLNPIEQLFSKLKHWLRRAAGRTADAVCARPSALSSRPSPHTNAQITSLTPGTDKRKFIAL